MVRQRARLRNIAFLAGATLCAALGPALRSAANDEAELPDEPQAAREGILVMRTGAIVSGKILKSGSVYEVQCAAGRMSVPGDLVKLRCADLAEAYERLHESAAARNDADAHLLLARWCLTNHLEREARRELQAALSLEPERDEARKLLRSTDDMLKAPKLITGKPPAPDDPVRAARIAAAAAADDGVSLGGLSRENAAQFARRIQPLLVANCTAAGCHGRDSPREFRLARVTPGKDANRHAAERNLVEVLAQIDVAKPRSSRLLTVPRGKHGRHGKPIFSGPRGEEQLADLRNWVVAISKESVVRAKFGKTARNGEPIRPVSAQEVDDGPVAKQQGGLPKARPFGNMGPEDASPPQRPLPASRDPFDPAAFNSTAGPRSRR